MKDVTVVIERCQARFATAEGPCRLFHGRGHRYPGYERLNVDWMPPYVVVTAFRCLECGALIQSLAALPGVEGVVVQRRDGRATSTEIAFGDVPDRFVVTENGLDFVIRPKRNQNVGLFLDMAPVREWLRRASEGARVLNLFSYTCAFSVYAVAGGAVSVVNNDMSATVLEWGRENHLANNHDLRAVSFLRHDLFKSWLKLKKLGPYDLMVIDPPTNQRGSFVAEKDYAKVFKRIPSLLRRGGRVVACLNSPFLPFRFLTEQMSRRCPQCRFEERLWPPDDFEEADPERGLKVAVFRLR